MNKPTYRFEDVSLPKFFSRRYATPRAFPPINPLIQNVYLKSLISIGLVFLFRKQEGFDDERSQDFFFNDGSDVSTDVARFKPWMLEVSSAAAIVFDQEPPLYCLDPDLFNDFVNTAPPTFQKPPFSFAMWIPERECSNAGCDNLHQTLFLVNSVDDSFFVIDFDFLSRDYGKSNVHCRPFTLGEKPNEWSTSLIANTIAYMNHYSEAVEVTDGWAKSYKGQGFSRPSKPTEMLRPRMISQAQRKRIVRRSSNPGQHHNERPSPVSHWRRGHWHKYRTGQGRKEEKLNWVEPILVNSGNAE